jgi:signal transduction histidine kinase/CheY-like chemotaxis protein
VHWVTTTKVPLVDPDGTCTRLLGTSTDITDRKRADEERERLETQLRQAQKMEAVGQLAGGIAHDFNNILTSIGGNVELALGQLQARGAADHRPLEELREVERSLARAAGLTRQLLAFGRRQVARPESLDLNQTVTAMEPMLRRLISESIVLQVIRGADLQCVRADANQVEQVVMNLVVNARDALPGGGTLTIETANVTLDADYVAQHGDVLPGPYVLLSVSDTGCGMDARTLERAFEPFFTTKPVGQGTGLGLATVYGIVKQSGGHVAAYSAPGHGSTFRVYLPAVDAPAVPQPAAAPQCEPAPTGVETVLVCEDDGVVRDLASRFLRSAGYTVLAAANGAEALRIAAANGRAVDLLVTDVVMPDMNGRQLADTLTAAMPNLAVLFVSGYTGSVIACHGVLDPGVEFLEKPFTRRELLRRVRDLLDRARRAA